MEFTRSFRANFVFQDGDVLIIDYPKTGVHWAFGFLPMILNESQELNYNQMPMFLDLLADLKALLAAHPKGCTRIFFTHLPFQLLPKNVKDNKKLKIVLILRNPKAVVNSFYWHMQDETCTGWQCKTAFAGEDFNSFCRRWLPGSGGPSVKNFSGDRLGRKIELTYKFRSAV
jgi:hypothetical protein